ncbi:hypothetical protein [Nonomuraea endophytica]|uniref:hypothetical protein n=1 Tax=Nonomuraea endophytica TaxID=714136 RepID=UPI0037CB9AFC
MARAQVRLAGQILHASSSLSGWSAAQAPAWRRTLGAPRTPGALTAAPVRAYLAELAELSPASCKRKRAAVASFRKWAEGDDDLLQHLYVYPTVHEAIEAAAAA